MIKKYYGWGLVYINRTRDRINITKLGKKIVDDGGWLKHLKQQSVKENSENEKLQNDLIMSRFHVKTRRYSLIISAIAVFISVLSFVFAYKAYKLVESKQQSETKISRHSTLILTSPKMADSLHIPKKPKSP